MNKIFILSFIIITFTCLSFIFALNIPALLLSKKAPAWITEIPIAHRGMHDLNIPENSLAAFRNAINHGYAIELDVHLSADGEAIVYHDEEMERLTLLKGPINSYTSDVLTNTCIGSSDEKIPTLLQVLELINSQVPVYIEIKNVDGTSKIEERVYEVVKDYQGSFAIISFNPHSLSWFKKKDPRIIRGQTASAFNTPGEKLVFSFLERFIFSNFLMNWYSQPHFITYNLADMPHLISQFLSLFTDVLTFGTENVDDYKKALVVSDNFMFDHIGKLIGKT